MNGDTQLELMYERFPVRDKRPRRFFWCDNEIIDVFGSELRLDGIGLYSFLARRANNETGELKVSMRKISQQTGSSCGHVCKLLHRIVDVGLAKLLKPGAPQNSAVYVLADVKELIEHKRSVHTVNTSQLTSVHSVNVHPMNAQEVSAAFTSRTPYKEVKTYSLNTKATPPVPPSCEGGAPGTMVPTPDARDLTSETVPPKMNWSSTTQLSVRDRRKLKQMVDALMWDTSNCRVHPNGGRTPEGNCWQCASDRAVGEQQPQMDLKNAINETCKQLLLDPELVHQLFRATGWKEGSGK
jgi:hypothetical protein